MRAQLEAEFIKIKRKKMVLAMFCFLAAAVSLIGVYFHFASVSEPGFHSFGKFTERCMSVISIKCTLCQGHYDFFLFRFLLYICLLCRGIKVMPLIDCFHLLL